MGLRKRAPDPLAGDDIVPYFLAALRALRESGAVVDPLHPAARVVAQVLEKPWLADVVRNTVAFEAFGDVAPLLQAAWERRNLNDDDLQRDLFSLPAGQQVPLVTTNAYRDYLETARWTGACPPLADDLAAVAHAHTARVAAEAGQARIGSALEAAAPKHHARPSQPGRRAIAGSP